MEALADELETRQRETTGADPMLLYLRAGDAERLMAAYRERRPAA